MREMGVGTRAVFAVARHRVRWAQCDGRTSVTVAWRAGEDLAVRRHDGLHAIGSRVGPSTALDWGAPKCRVYRRVRGD